MKRSGETTGVSHRRLPPAPEPVSPSAEPQVPPENAPRQDAVQLYQWQKDEKELLDRERIPVVPENFVDHEVWGKVLKEAISKSGWVDYRKLKRQKKTQRLLDAYVQDLSVLDPSTLADPKDRLASWLNLYNAMVLREILQHYPVKNILQIKDFFGKKRFKIGEKEYSLLEIEEKIFKEELGEPRALFARVNGASSGPRLAEHPYDPLKIEEQLEEATWKFLTNPANVRFDRNVKVLYLNPLLLWHQEDFVSLPAFLHTYLDLLPKYYGVAYTGYDWKLNDVRLH